MNLFSLASTDCSSRPYVSGHPWVDLMSPICFFALLRSSSFRRYCGTSLSRLILCRIPLSCGSLFLNWLTRSSGMIFLGVTREPPLPALLRRPSTFFYPSCADSPVSCALACNAEACCARITLLGDCSLLSSSLSEEDLFFAEFVLSSRLLSEFWVLLA